MAKKIILGIVGLGILWFLGHSFFIVSDGLNDEFEASDAVLILGTKSEYTGEPSKKLTSRLNRAIDLYHDKKAKKIIVTGGINDEVSAMVEYLKRYFVPDEDIIADRAGYNTYMKSHNTKEIMREQGMTSLIIITQYYKISRVKMAFHAFGLKDIYTAHAQQDPHIFDIFPIIREFVAYYYYLMRFI